MAYVMVPVPEDMVEDVMMMVVRRKRQEELEEFDEESMTEFYGVIDEPGRALLSTASNGCLDGNAVSEKQAADAMQMTQREVMGIVSELNNNAQDRSLPMLIIPRGRSTVLPNGKSQEVRVLSMAPHIAELVLKVDRAHLLAEGNPLTTGP